MGWTGGSSQQPRVASVYNGMAMPLYPQKGSIMRFEYLSTLDIVINMLHSQGLIFQSHGRDSNLDKPLSDKGSMSQAA